MKKVLFPFLVTSLLFSCKKEESPVYDNAYDSNSNPHGTPCWQSFEVSGQLLDATTGLPIDQKILNELTWPPLFLSNDTTDSNGNFSIFMGYQPCGTIGVLGRPNGIRVKLVGDTTYVLDSIVVFSYPVVNDSVWVNLYAYPN